MKYKIIGYWDHETNRIVDKLPDKSGWYRFVIKPEMYELGCWTEGMTVQHKENREIFTVVGSDDKKDGYIMCKDSNGHTMSYDYRHLECFDCNIMGHDWKEYALFTGSYKKCKRCGREE